MASLAELDEKRAAFTLSQEAAHRWLAVAAPPRHFYSFLPKGTPCGDYQLREWGIVFVRPSSHQVVATFCWSPLREYGIGDSDEEAIQDLLLSLSDYYPYLLEREGRLAPEELQDLAILKGILWSGGS